MNRFILFLQRFVAILLILGNGWWQAQAAIPAGGIWTVRSGATSGNLGPGLFNPGNANFLTDGTVDTNTGNTDSPVFSSASYNFVAGDVGAWLYVKSGTNTYPGWYQIASVASNKATLTAGVGAGIWHNATSRTYTVSTSAGIASTGTPSSITFGIDYSQSTGNLCSATDLVIDGTTNTDITSATCAFSVRHLGNGIRITTGTGFTAGVYEIVSIPSGTTARLDRAVGTLSSTGGTGRVGGAISLGSGSAPTDDTVFEAGVAGNDWFIENGTYTVGGTVTIAATGGTQNPIRIFGYNSLRGDNPTGSTRPTLNAGANTLTVGTNWNMAHVQLTGSASPLFTSGTSSVLTHVKGTNTSTTANRVALNLSNNTICYWCEGISYRGRGINVAGTSVSVIGSYVHDSDIGLLLSGNGATFILGNISASNVTAAISVAASISAPLIIDSNTLYGAEQNPTGPTTGIGTGITVATGVTNLRITNNIIKGFAIGGTSTDAQSSYIEYYNAYHGNAADAGSNWVLGPGSIIGTAPSFTAVTQVTGTGASSSTNVLTAASGTPFTTVVDNRDFITLISGSGTGFASGKYLITSHTDNTVTVSSNITSSGSGSSIVWEVTLGKDFSIGSALSQTGFPGVFPGGLTTGYRQTGAVGKQAGGSGGTRIY